MWQGNLNRRTKNGNSRDPRTARAGGFGGGRGGRGGGGVNAGTFRTLTGYSLDSTNSPRSFLSSEENYQFLKSLQEKNLIVPVSGDFGGPKAIRAIGAYIREHGSVLRAFYVSNVEQYLFMEAGKPKTFYDNVATLPIDAKSVFVRPYSMRRFGRNGYPGDPAGSVRSICPIASFLAAVAAGKVQTNDAALACGM